MFILPKNPAFHASQYGRLGGSFYCLSSSPRRWAI